VLLFEVNQQRLQSELPAPAEGIASGHGARTNYEYVPGNPKLLAAKAIHATDTSRPARNAQDCLSPNAYGAASDQNTASAAPAVIDQAK
jgi:hypothetical protein